jgi:hypothetical protein
MIPPGLGRWTLSGKRSCKVIIEQWEAIRCGLNKKSCDLISEERQMKRKIVAVFLVTCISCIAGAADTIAPLPVADIGSDLLGLLSVKYNGTTYTTAQLATGTTTRYYAIGMWDQSVPALWVDSGVRAVWVEGTALPADIYSIPNSSNAKVNDGASRADNFKWNGTGTGGSNNSDMSSMDALPYMETMFANPAKVIFYFERGTGYDLGTVYGITGGVLGAPIALTAAAWTPTAITYTGGVVKAYSLTFDQPVNGVRFAVPGGDALTVCTIPEPATMIMLGLGGLALLRKRS